MTSVRVWIQRSGFNLCYKHLIRKLPTAHSRLLQSLLMAMGSVADLSGQWMLFAKWLASLMSIVGLLTLSDTVYAKLLVLGFIIETGLPICQWLIGRLKFRVSHLSTVLWVAANCNVLSRVFPFGPF